MKATNVFLSFLVFSFCTNSYFCAAAEEPHAVLDSDGEKVQAGLKYFILPVTNDTGGGLRFISFGPEDCNNSVAQTTFYYEGFSLTFTPAYNNDSVIRLSTDLNFNFVDVGSTCQQDTFVWRVRYDESVGKYIIDTNGVLGNPGINTLSNWFKISKYGSHYKIVYCPTVCDTCHFDCKDIGTFIQNDMYGNKHGRLYLNGDEPFEVIFQKKKVSLASS